MSGSKPSVFIGSAYNAIAIARALEEHLDRDFEVTVWQDGTFPLGSTPIEALLEAIRHFDFASFVLTPEDQIVAWASERDRPTVAPRDNVIFELGLFIGALGRQRVFAVAPANADMHLLSDLVGVTVATYDGHRPTLTSAVAPAATRIRAAMLKINETKRDHEEISLYESRAAFDQAQSYDRHFQSATSIDAVGISLNMVTSNVNFSSIKNVLAQPSAAIRLLFQAPYSPELKKREKEEGYDTGLISKMTEGNIQIIEKFKRELTVTHPEAVGRLQVKFYFGAPRLNLYIVSRTIAIIQHYVLDRRGTDTPCLLVTGESPDSPNIRFYRKLFEEMWSSPLARDAYR